MKTKRLIFSTSVCGEYGESQDRDIKSSDELRSFVEDFTKDSYLTVKIQYGLDHFPMIDLDSQDYHDKAQTILIQNNISYVSIESSPGKYWIIIDKMCDVFREALYTIEKFPLPCDHQFLDAAKIKKVFHARACPKNGHVPHVIPPPKKMEFSDEFIKFIDGLNSFYESSAMIIMKHRPLFLEELESKKHRPASIFGKQVKKSNEDLDVWDTL